MLSGAYLVRDRGTQAQGFERNAAEGRLSDSSDRASPQFDPAGPEGQAIVGHRQLDMIPLPDDSLPLMDQFHALLQRAERGDPVASCRLVVSLYRCRGEQQQWEFTQKMTQSLERGAASNEGMLIERIASSQEKLEKSGGYCKDVDTRLLPRPETLFQYGLNSYSPRQKTVLAMMRSDGSIRRVNSNLSYFESGSYVFPQFLADHTVEFLMAGYAAKEPMALEGLVMLHAPGKALTRGGVGLLLPNPRLFLQYSMLMRELFGPESIGQSGLRLMQVTESTMTGAQLDEIRRRVSVEAVEWRRSLAAGSEESAWQLATTEELAFRACSK